MQELLRDETGRIIFTEEMRKEYTILVPGMLPVHFGLLKNLLINEGYNIELLENEGPSVVEEGLMHVHNDTCYPALLVIGQMIDALKSGKYDTEKTALIITQTGGGCRASNYIHLLRKALVSAGFPNVPVVSLNMSGLEKNPGFKITLKLVMKLLAGVVLGDEIMLLANQTRPYEVEKGATDRLINQWQSDLTAQFNAGKGYSGKKFKENMRKVAESFAKIEIKKVPKIKVGVVGEIYIKYAALGNNHLEEFLREQDCEVMVPGLIDFIIFKCDNRVEDHKLYGGGFLKSLGAGTFLKLFVKWQNELIKTVETYTDFMPPSSYWEIKDLVKGVIGYGNKMGEGWLLTGEMIELTTKGYGNIVCAQPFGCLPNHICGKGMIRRIKELYPQANIVPIDYDPGATRVNQENRIKLMLSVAKEELEAQNAE